MWTGSLNIDGVKNVSCEGSKNQAIFTMQHYFAVYMQDADDVNKRITLTIQKRKDVWVDVPTVEE